MRQSLYFHVGLFAVAVVLAYLVWTGDKPDRQEQPTIVDLDAAAVRGLQYTWPEGETAIVPSAAGATGGYEVALTRRIKKLRPQPASKPASQPAVETAASQPASESTADAAASQPASQPAPEPEVVEEKSRFPAGDAVVKAVEQLAPLKAVRSLGEVTGERLGKMGLDAPERRVAVEAAGKGYTLEIGATTYGAQGRYARLQGSQEVFLVASTLVSGLEGTERRLMEQRLVPVEIEEITALEVGYGVQRARFVHVEREQASKRHFALAATPDLRSEEADGLVEQLRGLRATAYLEQPPAPGSVTDAARFVVQRADGAPLEVQLLEKADGSGYLAQAGPWFARLADAPARALLDQVAGAMPSE